MENLNYKKELVTMLSKGTVEYYSKDFSILANYNHPQMIFEVVRNKDRKQITIATVDLDDYSDEAILFYEANRGNFWLSFIDRVKAKFNELKTKYIYDYQNEINCD